MDRRTGLGWSQERADAAEREYRRFLYLMKKFPQELAAPSIEVDMFWHQHILDTVQYARDCEAVFGHFMHHNPYLGMGLSGDDSALWRHAGQRMRELYEQTFGAQPERSQPDETPEAACAREATAFCVRDETPFSAWPTDTAFHPKDSDTAFCVRATLQPPRLVHDHGQCLAGGAGERRVDLAEQNILAWRRSRH